MHLRALIILGERHQAAEMITNGLVINPNVNSKENPMSNQELHRIKPEDLLKEIYHELNQKSASALTFAIMLTDENRIPLSNDKQKEFLLRLKGEIEAMRRINDTIYEWLAAK